jgi:hypothetical protein
MVLACLVTAALVFAMPPSIDPHSLGDRDPVPFEPPDARSSGNGVQDLQPFSDALTREELAHSIANLPIADEVRQALLACAAKHYSAYLSAHDAVGARHAAHYIGICQKQATKSTSGVDPTLEEIQERDREADVVRRELKAAERDFILMVQDCLDEALVSIERPQAADDTGSRILEPLALKAQRRYCEVSLRPRGDGLELRDMVNGLELDSAVRKSVEPELLDYERSLAALKPAQCKAYWGSSLRVALYEAGRPLARQSPATCGRLGIQIRQAAQAAASHIAALLPEKPRQAFEREVYRGIYPELAVDPKGDALAKDFAAALARTDLSRDDMERLHALQEYWSLESKAWRMKAEEQLLDWWDRNACWQRGYAIQVIRSNRDALLKQRDELHERWRLILADQLPTKIAP